MTPSCNIAVYAPVTQFAIYFKVLAGKSDSVLELSHARSYHKNGRKYACLKHGDLAIVFYEFYNALRAF